MVKNVENVCNCTNEKCTRYGKCNECIEFHKKLDNLPYCKR